ncbi:MAG: CPBP family intramembrane metalloprotease [Anaerolineales bacterium]|nr:CPBP family intramembrane metalloprotease [Anaerolineales bacterium]
MKKSFISFLLVLSGAAIFVLGNPYYSVFPTNGNQEYALAMTVFFLVVSVILKRIPSFSVYGPAAYALFMASAGLLFMGTGVLNLQRSTMPPLQFLAMDKLSQFLYVVPVLVGLTLLAKGDLNSIFIGTGKLKGGLTFGLVSFASFAVIALAMGLQSNDFFPSLRAATPWLLLFIFANAIMEELWLRGIFLRNYETILGRNAAILVTAIVFGASHINATYNFPGGGFVFGLVVFGLGLVGAYAMFKDDSLIGPILFHAGYDLLVIVPILNSL